jgi:hypothetical protein
MKFIVLLTFDLFELDGMSFAVHFEVVGPKELPPLSSSGQIARSLPGHIHSKM